MTDNRFAPVTLAAVLLFLLSAAAVAQGTSDWADSPEAYFLTAGERGEWSMLRSQPERDAFTARYWLRRDPTPGTPANEFRALVGSRIGYANENFRVGPLHGAETARGFAFVVFGAPSRVSEEAASRPTSSRGPIGPNDGLERLVVWKYERDRNPRLLKMLNRPNLELTFYIEPERKRDRFEIDKLPYELAAIVAEKSIVNPDAAGPIASPAPPLRLMPRFRASGELGADDSQALTAETAATGICFGHATLLRSREIAVWFFVPAGSTVGTPRIVARITDAASNTDTAVAGMSVQPTTEVTALQAGSAFGLRIPLPAPGTYLVQAALLDGAKTLATGTIPRLVTPDAGGLQVSNVVVSGGVDAVRSPDGAFAWGDVEVVPRADATFRRSEPLWYFLQVANPSAAESLVLDVRLRRGNAPHGEPVRMPAEAGSIGENLYLVGRELPLASLEPGSYSLYVKVIDGAVEKVARADFTVVP